MTAALDAVHKIVFRAAALEQDRAAVFLDRDGVVNVERRYVHRREDFEFQPGIFDAARRFVAAGYALVIITNQAGIARGYYGFDEFRALSEWMSERFRAAGAPLDAIYFCPHHPDGMVAELKVRCGCRKPKPDMILAASQQLRLDLSRSVLVGDKLSDIAAGRAAGVRHCLLLSDSTAAAHFANDLPPDLSVTRPDAQLAGLQEAADVVLPPTSAVT